MTKGGTLEKVQIVTAFCAETGLILGSKAIPKKTNEIPVLREMLELFDIAGKTITADPLHCQNDTVERIVELGGHYVIGLKKNQKTFYNDVQKSFENTEADGLPQATTTEKNKGRIERRTCTVNNNAALIGKYSHWSGLKSVLCFDRETTKKDETTYERSFYISDLEETPERFLEIVRSHWAIEGRLHFSLDCGAFDEDDCRIRSKNGNITMNIFRKFAIGLQKNYIDAVTETKTKPSIVAHMKKCLLNNKLLTKAIAFVKNL